MLDRDIRATWIPTYSGPEVPIFGKANGDTVMKRLPSLVRSGGGWVFYSRLHRLPAFVFYAMGKIRKREVAKPLGVSLLHPNLIQIGHDA